jgi:hypothetical protein
VKVNVNEAFKINKDKMMLNKSNLKERKGKGMYIDDDLGNEERKTQKNLKEVARYRGKRVKIGYRKRQINGEWFIWDEREEKLKKHF